MHHHLLCILLTLSVLMSLVSCDRTPGGVLSKSDMANLIADLQLAEAYMENHIGEFPDDSSKMVLKQSVLKKYGITQQEYDSSLVWYAHNTDDYIRAYDQAIGKLKARHDKLDKGEKEGLTPAEMVAEGPSKPEGSIKKGAKHLAEPMGRSKMHPKRYISTNTKGDSADLWQGSRYYMLTPGFRRGFITFDVRPDANKQPGDRYQLSYKLTRGGNEFKVSLNIDYTDGSTAQIYRGTNSDGWVSVDVQSDTARQVRRVYGYVSYDMKRGHTAYVDSLMLQRTRFDKSRYGFINAQRLVERKKK